MNLFSSFIKFIEDRNLFTKNDRLILAVSGGIDSVALCELCKQAEYNFIIAHCNFKLRNEESERDEKFVRSLAEKYNIEVLVKAFDTETYSVKNKLSIQVAARELRYNWFKELVEEYKWPTLNEISINNIAAKAHHQRILVLTAHHANDDIETLLMNFFKGTGIAGLRGIQSKANHIIRPLLFATKEQIKNFAAENKLPFAEDSSNATDKYTRNYFRNQLIPSIQKVFPEVEKNLMDNINRFSEIQLLYQQSISLYKKKLLEKKGEEIHIPVLKLLKAKPIKTILYEIVKDYGFTPHQIEMIENLLGSNSGKYLLSSSHKIIKNRNWLIITPIDTTVSENILIEENDRNIEFIQGNLKIETLTIHHYHLSAIRSVAQLDADQITFPLLLRKWKQGDYFYPLGMKKKKKLSRFFIDQKLSIAEKENIWVIEMNKKIIWIINQRIDDRFKITGNTKNVIRFSLL